jgi:uncharacterized damage-inducible protein DinB
MTLSSLGYHIANIPSWLQMISEKDELDLAGMNFSTPGFTATSELVKEHDENVAKGTEALRAASNEQLFKPWKLRSGEHIIFELPRIAVVRNMVLNHVVHHRGQLSVYLRLLNIPVPGMYGPSADEIN